MDLDRVTREARRHYRRQAALSKRTAQSVSRLWDEIDAANISATWRPRALMAAQVVAAGQAAAAADADDYLKRQARAQSAAPGGSDVVASAFAGRTASGDSLSTLTELPAITSKLRIAQGATTSEALLSGKTQLALMAANEVAQAGRNAASVGIWANKAYAGYIRMLTAPSCSRCAILAGKFYRYSTGFQRHPRCDCVHVPAAEAGVKDLRTNPRDYFSSLSTAAQDKTFGKAGAAAIREGADMSQVVNISRNSGLYTFETGGVVKQATLEGTNVLEGMAGRRLAMRDGQFYNRDGSIRIPDLFDRSRPRLTPKQIFADSRTRDEAISKLHEYGYLEPTPIRRSHRELFRDLGADRHGVKNGLAPSYPR